jgi:hypothetical protein
VDDDLQIYEPMRLNPGLAASVVVGSTVAVVGTVALSGVIGLAAILGQTYRMTAPFRRAENP